jgi:glycosyltransferase involved in cell wall biosynthesis
MPQHHNDGTKNPERYSSVSCIVPSLNESESLQVLLPALQAVLEKQNLAWEIIVVDDGSTDDTQRLMEIWTDKPGFRYLQFSRNFGKEAAITAGLEAADGNAVICLDSDLQHPPELIPEMLARWRAGADMVYAVRSHRNDESWLKRLGSRALYALLSKGSQIRIPENAGDFRLMDRQVVTALLQLPERTRFMKGLYAWVGFVSVAVEYQPPDRQFGRSHFNYLRLVKLALDAITSFSTWPLKMMSLTGFAVALASMVYGIYIVIEYIFIGNEVSGWTTIVTAMLFLSGVNLLGLGLIGTYIARIFDESKQRPLYLIRRRLGSGLNSTTR